MSAGGQDRHEASTPVVLDTVGLDALIAALAADGREVIGPVRRDGAVVHEPVGGVDDLPRGWVDEQSGGHYRLHQEGDAIFGVTHGPQGWKRILHPPKEVLWSVDTSGSPKITAPAPDATPRAFLGVRPCDLAAIAIQDKVFLDGPFRDPRYASRRENLFLVAVNCTRSAATCFCTSMGTGPEARAGYDIVLTEIEGGVFLAAAGSAAGAQTLAALATRPAKARHLASAAAGIACAADQQRKLDTDGLPDLLKANPDHRRWDEVASRCLNCANCTMVCPTCFCTSVDEVSALDGSGASREQRWASCFTTEFSHVHGGAVRPGAKARYRQWMTHKLGTWVDQFDSSGCTGCGRCISWCPVGIDITEEAAMIRGEGGGP
jgi:ferredoxin